MTHIATTRPMRNQVLTDRSTIKYAVNIYQGLPNITGICARDANTIGDFGLVSGRFTNCYQLLPSRRSESLRRSATFTISASAAKAHNTLDDDD